MPDRTAHGKVVSREELRLAMEREDMVAAIPGRPSLGIDNTDLSPAAAARTIAGHFALPPGQTLRPS